MINFSIDITNFPTVVVSCVKNNIMYNGATQFVLKMSAYKYEQWKVWKAHAKVLFITCTYLPQQEETNDKTSKMPSTGKICLYQ